MRLIDAVVVEERLWDARRAYQLMDNSQDADKIMHGIYNAEQIIREATTVDAVPVCRCEKCVYWDAGTRQHHKDGESEWDEAICDYFHEIGISQTVYTNANWFCADGERKGGDE